MSGALTKSAAKGVTWSGTAQVISQVARFVATIILARLLSPEDFGIVATAAIVTDLLLRIGDMGFSSAIIQRKEVTPSHLSTVFWTTLAFGIVFCLTIVGISPLAANFFENGLVRPVMAVSSIVFIIASLRMVHGALLLKKLQFFHFSICEIGYSLSYVAAAISLAFAGFGVWSIVFGNLASQIILVVLRWSLCRWYPSATFSISSLKDLWQFGANLTAGRIVLYLTERLDYLIIGKFITLASLGFYSLSYKIVSMLTQATWVSVNIVAFSTFSIVQDEDERLRRGFTRSVAYISLIIVPCFVGLAITAPEIIRVIIDPKWEAAIWPMQILCIYAVVSSIRITTISVLRAKGRTDIELKLNIISLFLLIPSLLIGVQFGIVGAAIAVSTVNTIMWLVNQIIANRLTGLSMVKYLSALRPAIFGSAVMAIVLLGYRYMATSLLSLPDVWLLVSSVMLGAAIYFVTLKATRTEALNNMIELVIEVVMPYINLIMLKIPLLKKEAVPVIDPRRKEN